MPAGTEGLAMVASSRCFGESYVLPPGALHFLTVFIVPGSHGGNGKWPARRSLINYRNVSTHDPMSV